MEAPVWRIQATSADLTRALVACDLPANALVVPDAAWAGTVPESAFIECPTFFLPGRTAFLALLSFFITRSLRFRLLVRSGHGESDGVLQAYPRLDAVSVRQLARFDELAADQVMALGLRLERLFAQIEMAADADDG